jgi:hypothetical protein
MRSAPPSRSYSVAFLIEGLPGLAASALSDASIDS